MSYHLVSVPFTLEYVRIPSWSISFFFYFDCFSDDVLCKTAIWADDMPKLRQSMSCYLILKIKIFKKCFYFLKIKVARKCFYFSTTTFWFWSVKLWYLKLSIQVQTLKAIIILRKFVSKIWNLLQSICENLLKIYYEIKLFKVYPLIRLFILLHFMNKNRWILTLVVTLRLIATQEKYMEQIKINCIWSLMQNQVKNKQVKNIFYLKSKLNQVSILDLSDWQLLCKVSENATLNLIYVRIWKIIPYFQANPY